MMVACAQRSDRPQQQMSDVDYYEILGVGPEAEPDEIDQAYERELARIHQGELASEPERARLLAEARVVLLDPTTRAEYDARCVGQGLIDETAAAILAAHQPRMSARDYFRAKWALVVAALRARRNVS